MEITSGAYHDTDARATLHDVRACVVVPGFADFYGTPHRVSALGARIVVRMLEAAGWEVSLLILPAQSKPAVTPTPDWLSHLAPYIDPEERGPVSFFRRYYRFGPSPETGARAIANERPDVVFLSVFAYAYAEGAILLARSLKRALPDVKIVAGGAGVSVAPWYFQTEQSGIDEILTGEAEQSLAEWLGDSVSSPVSPMPAVAAHAARQGTALTTMLSRGCPRACAFCANHLCHGRTFRTVDVNELAATIDSLRPTAPLAVNFEDDNILFASDYFLRLLETLSDRYGTLHLTAENGLDYQFLRPGVLSRLIAFGFERFNLSLGGIDPELLHAQRRPVRLDQLEYAVRSIAAAGADSTTYFICGLPGDSPANVVRTLAYLAGLPTRPGISLFYPVPGLAGFEDRTRFDGVPPGLAAGSSAFPWTGALTTAELVTAFRLSRLVGFAHAWHHGGIRGQEHRELFDTIVSTTKLLTLGPDGRPSRPPGVDREMEEEFFELTGSALSEVTPA